MFILTCFVKEIELMKIILVFINFEWFILDGLSLTKDWEMDEFYKLKFD